MKMRIFLIFLAPMLMTSFAFNLQIVDYFGGLKTKKCQGSEIGLKWDFFVRICALNHKQMGSVSKSKNEPSFASNDAWSITQSNGDVLDKRTKQALNSMLQMVIEQFPVDLGDTLHYDNIRFLRYRLKPDSIANDRLTIDVDRFICHFDSMEVVNVRNRFYHSDLEKVFEAKPERLTIDTVFYTYLGESYRIGVNKSFVIVYPKDNNYIELLDYPGKSFHDNSFKAITSAPTAKSKGRKGQTWKAEFELVKYNSENVRYVYSDRYYMNMGELPGVNLITVRNGNNDVIFKRLIDGRNQRIEDFMNFFGHDELFVEVRGNLHWDIVIRFLE